jgi:hypothetical protein
MVQCLILVQCWQIASFVNFIIFLLSLYMLFRLEINYTSWRIESAQELFNLIYIKRYSFVLLLLRRRVSWILSWVMIKQPFHFFIL